MGANIHAKMRESLKNFEVNFGRLHPSHSLLTRKCSKNQSQNSGCCQPLRFIWVSLTHSFKYIIFNQIVFDILKSQTKLLHFDANLIEICSPGSNQQYFSTGSDSGLALIRQQAIIWTNDDHFTDTNLCHSPQSDKNDAYIHLWNVITHSCPKFNSSSDKPLLKSGQVCVITLYWKIWM